MIIFIYHLSVILIGYWIYKRYFHEKKSLLFTSVSSLVLGLLISLPATYVLCVFFQQSADPISLGSMAFCISTLSFFWIKRKELLLVHSTLFLSTAEIKPTKRYQIITEIFITLFSLILSIYVMVKTFKTNSDGTIMIARNAVFDFGHSISIIRSMSWGNNIPYTSPFVSGTEQIYHFMFHFWAAILEHLGMPVFFAVNLPSIIGFTLFLLTVYLLGKEVFGKVLIGFLGVLFTVFHSGFMFIPFFQKFGFSFLNILHNPNYFFVGPFDGSIYSIFFTLNVFINQRQLGISLAIFFLIYMLFMKDIEKEKLTFSKILIYALVTGFFSLWHLVLSTGLLFVLTVSLLVKKKWKESFILISNTLFVAIIFIHPWISSLIRASLSILRYGLGSGVSEHTSQQSVLIWVIEFIILNFGISLIFFLTGVLKEKKVIRLFFPIFLLVGIFTFFSIPAGIIDQKFSNVLLVVYALFTAAGVNMILKKGLLLQLITIVIFPFLILSGIIDFMVIKNDYMFPIAQTTNGKLVSWINKNTEKNATFISYDDIFDPVTLAGRKNYYGFFKQPDIFLEESDKYRMDKIKNIFDATDEETLRYAIDDTGVDYFIMPPVEKKDFPYVINFDLMKKTFPILLNDDDELVFDVKKIN